MGRDSDSEDAVQPFLDAGGGGAVSRVGSELLADANLWSQQIFERSPNGSLVKGFPFQFRRWPMAISSDSPALGEHTREILASL